MKVLVAVFALNEEETIADVIHSIPNNIPGVTSVSVVVIDDGSTDQTSERAVGAGAAVIRHPMRRGLPRALMTAIDEAIKIDADILVHTDGDNQFDQADIPRLVEPILKYSADVVIGNRDITHLDFMPAANKWGNRLGSAALNALLRLPNVDVSCGFRAYSKESYSHLFIFSNHTYTHESLIQLSSQKFRIASIPIKCKPRTVGESKLISNITAHVSRSLLTIVRAALYHSPLRFFTWIGGVFFAFGIILGIRYLIIYFTTNEPGHLQSIILASVCLILGFSIFIVGLYADLINRNTRLNHEMLYLLRTLKKNRTSDSITSTPL